MDWSMAILEHRSERQAGVDDFSDIVLRVACSIAVSIASEPLQGFGFFERFRAGKRNRFTLM
jgi:hypothetical protein